MPVVRRLTAAKRPRNSVREIPTTTLYLTEPVTPLLGEFGLDAIERIALNVYRMGDVVVISRYASMDDLAVALRCRPKRLCYIIDDDIEAACSDTLLPPLYRESLVAFYRGSYRSILAASTDIVLSSPALLRYYRDLLPGVRYHLIDPVWPDAKRSPLGGLGAKQRSCRIAYLGAKTHYHDYQLIAPILSRLLREHGNVRLVSTIATKELCEQSFRNLKVVGQTGWERYLNWVLKQRFDIGLYPLRDTKFNRSRSVNKLYEYRLTGAMCLLSRNEAFETLDWEARDRCRFMVGPSPSDWYHKLKTLIDSPQRCAAETRHFCRALDQRNPRARAQSTWRAILAGE